MSKKLIPVIIAIFLVIAIILTAGFFILFRSSPVDKIVDNLKNGKYEAAYNIYVDKYGKGYSDTELRDALSIRLTDIVVSVENDEFSYYECKSEIDTIKKMNISELNEKVEYALSQVEGSKAADKVDNQTATVATTAAVTTTLKAADPPNQNLQKEPVPYASQSPVIVSASTIKGSVLAASNVAGYRSFEANKAIDGYYDSCWCVNTNSTGGAGAAIRFDLKESSVVSGVTLVNGNLYLPNDELFLRNGQVKNFTLTFSDGSRKSFTAGLNSNGSSNPQYFSFDTPVITSSITLTVNSGYAGYKFTTNVCIGEFNVY